MKTSYKAELTWPDIAFVIVILFALNGLILEHECCPTCNCDHEQRHMFTAEIRYPAYVAVLVVSTVLLVVDICGSISKYLKNRNIKQ